MEDFVKQNKLVPPKQYFLQNQKKMEYSCMLPNTFRWKTKIKISKNSCLRFYSFCVTKRTDGRFHSFVFFKDQTVSNGICLLI